MRLTFVNDMGQSFVIEIDPQMSLEDIMALLEVEVRTLFQNIILMVLILFLSKCSRVYQHPNRVYLSMAVI